MQANLMLARIDIDLVEIVTQTEHVTVVERALEQMGFFGRYKDILEVVKYFVRSEPPPTRQLLTPTYKS